MSGNRVVSRQRAGKNICPIRFDISCVNITRGMPTWEPQKDQLPFAYDTESRALWIYTAEKQWVNTAEPLPPTVSAVVNNGQVATGVMTQITANHNPDCINGGDLLVDWVVYDSNQVEIASGTVTIPTTAPATIQGGTVTLPMPNLTGGSGPFRLATTARDYCGVSAETEVFFTTA